VPFAMLLLEQPGRFAAFMRFPKERPGRLCVQVRRLQAAIEHATCTSLLQPKAQIGVRVPPNGKPVRGHPDAKEIAPPRRHVAQPQSVQDGELPRLEPVTVALVLFGV